MAHKIAILKVDDQYDYNDYDYSHKIILESITEWQTVSHEDYLMLRQAEARFSIKVIEQVTELETFIPKTVADYTEILRKEKEKEAAEKKKRADAALAKKLKKDMKDKESKLELFNKLKAELGEQAR